MPSVTTVPSETQEKDKASLCGAVVKRVSSGGGQFGPSPKTVGIPYDAPLFHWYTKEDQERQLKEYMKARFQIPEEETAIAVAAGNRAQEVFRRELKERAEKF